jgi:hypothetical protein
VRGPVGLLLQRPRRVPLRAGAAEHDRTPIAFDALLTSTPSTVAVATMRTLRPASLLSSFSVSFVAPLIEEQRERAQSCHR